MMTKNEQVTAYIEKAPAPQKEILRRLRELIAEAVPGASEQFKWGQPVYGMPGDFCYLKAAKDHVNLGFMDFTGLDDPDGLLEGTGKNMRHIKLRAAGDIRARLFKGWLRTAAERIHSKK